MKNFKPSITALAPLALALLTAGGVGLWATRSVAQDKDAKAAPKPALTVTAVQPQQVRLAVKLAANGNLMAWQEASVGAETNGLRLTEVRVNVGDRVKKGDVLATFSADTVRAESAQARASLMEAEATAAEAAGNAERARSLQASGALERVPDQPVPDGRADRPGPCGGRTRPGPGAAGAPEPGQRAGARRRHHLRARRHGGRRGGRGHRAVSHDPQGPAGMARRSHLGRAGPRDQGHAGASDGRQRRAAGRPRAHDRPDRGPANAQCAGLCGRDTVAGQCRALPWRACLRAANSSWAPRPR
jgi:pyruvate/2-oxoglutarate dehydrogenase complex dihydrolipoamide acyltransferase (E2) component